MKHAISLLFTLLTISMCFSIAHAADKAVLASGAGYKKMVNELCADYQQKTGKKPELIYGNMARVTSQAKVSGKVDLLIGAKWFLDRSGIKFKRMEPLGRGRLVAACIQGKEFKDSSTLESDEISRIALPDPKRAIYGRAAFNYLKNKGLDKKLKDKLVIVATVPQVSSYVISKEVDLGFINLTHALNIQDKIGSYTEIKLEDYPPIEIVVGIINETQEARNLLEYISSTTAQDIIKKHGL